MTEHSPTRYCIEVADIEPHESGKWVRWNDVSTAVNAHAKLVEALGAVHNWLGNETVPDPDPNRQRAECWKLVDAALALAREVEGGCLGQSEESE